MLRAGLHGHAEGTKPPHQGAGSRVLCPGRHGSARGLATRMARLRSLAGRGRRRRRAMCHSGEGLC
jgi:hypothetical protein